METRVMLLYKTQDITKIGCYDVVVKGMDIYATDIEHFKLALQHHGKVHTQIVDVIELNDENTRDSLLTPSKIQLN